MQKYRGKDYELKISRVKMEDKGEYIVKAENSFGKREELGILKVDGELVLFMLSYKWALDVCCGGRVLFIICQ